MGNRGSINTKVVTGKIRMNYVNLFSPRVMKDGDEPKYSLCVLIPKEDRETINKIIRATEEAKKEVRALWGGEPLENIKVPLRDGDVERADQEEYRDHYFLNAISRNKPGIVDMTLNKIWDEREVYSGCYGRVSLVFYPFNHNGNKGIGCGLQNVQKLGDGEVLSIRSKAEDDFGLGY